MSAEKKRAELTKAEYDALVEAVGYYCSHTGTVDESLPGGCRDCDNEVRYPLAGVVAEIIAAREDATWREAMLEAAETVENAGDYGYGGWVEDDLRSAAYRLRALAEEPRD